MNNLMTRKIVLGLLMVLVLAFSVQGTADAAIINLTSSGISADLSWRDIGGMITVSISGTANTDNTVESVTFTVSNGATFDLTDPAGARSTHTWGETGAATNTFESTITGSTTVIPGTVTFTVPRAGEVTATLSATGATTQYLTFYVVKDRFTVTATDTVGLDNITNGVGGRYSGNVKIHSGVGRNNPVTYMVTGSGASLYIQKGTDTTRQLTSLASVGSNGQTSSNADVWLDMAADTSSTVTAWVTNGGRRTQGVYIHGNPSLTVTTTPATFAGPPDSASQNGTANNIAVTVFDQTTAGTTGRAGVPNVPVKFDASATGGFLIPDSTPGNDGFSTTIVDSGNNPIMHADVPALAQTLYVRTSERTLTAEVGFQFGTIPGKSDIQISISGRNFTTVTKKVEATVTGTGTTTLTIDANKRLSGNSKRFELVALVERNGETVRGLSVTFRTSHGLLTNTPTGDTTITDPDGGATVNDTTSEVEKTQVMDITDRLGKARVIYDLGSNTGRQEIDAIIYEGDPKNKRQVTFVVNGPAGIGGVGGTTPVNRLAITPTSISGDPDDTETITVTALNTNNLAVPGVLITLGGDLSDFVTAGGAASSTSGVTPFTSTLTLADTADTYIISANATGYTSTSTVVTVEAPTNGTLTISPSGTPVNGEQKVNITARTSGGAIPAGAVPVTLSGTGFTTTRATVLSGTVSTNVTLPTTAATYTLTVRATGYNEAFTRLTVSTTTTRGPAGVADSVEIDGQRQLSGTVNQVMRLRVRVLDANDNGVSDVRVAFRVLAPGRGTFSGGRGNRRGVTDETDRNGYASANFTPSDDGNIIVRATPAGVRDPVTFIIAVGEAADDPEPPTPSRDVPPSRDISPVVHVGVSSRPPMLWVDGGAIYALVGADAQKFAPSVDNALNIVIGGGKVYWTEKTGDAGTINSANLNGSDVTELTSIKAVPMGIAVDVAGSKLYWTNSRGRIQSANLDGSGITNELQDLPSPMDIALGRGLVYWTQGNGSVRLVNLRGQKIVRDISTGTDTPGSLVIGGSKVYWTEMTGGQFWHSQQCEPQRDRC